MHHASCLFFSSYVFIVMVGSSIQAMESPVDWSTVLMTLSTPPQTPKNKYTTPDVVSVTQSNNTDSSLGSIGRELAGIIISSSATNSSHGYNDNDFSKSYVPYDERILYSSLDRTSPISNFADSDEPSFIGDETIKPSPSVGSRSGKRKEKINSFETEEENHSQSSSVGPVKKYTIKRKHPRVKNNNNSDEGNTKLSSGGTP